MNATNMSENSYMFEYGPRLVAIVPPVVMMATFLNDTPLCELRIKNYELRNRR